MSEISDRILAVINERDISYGELAEMTGISKSALQRYATGETEKIPIDRLPLIAKALGTTAEYFMGWNSNKGIDQNIDPTGVIKPTGWIPIYGVIPAGVPALAEECIEGYQPTMLRNPDEYFYLRVNGDSMIGAGIQTGSLVLIHIQSTAENGDIVACRVNGDEATLKRFKQTDDKIFLLPENADYDPIVVSPKDFSEGCAQIMGVAKQVVMSL